MPFLAPARQMGRKQRFAPEQCTDAARGTFNGTGGLNDGQLVVGGKDSPLASATAAGLGRGDTARLGAGITPLLS